MHMPNSTFIIFLEKRNITENGTETEGLGKEENENDREQAENIETGSKSVWEVISISNSILQTDITFSRKDDYTPHTGVSPTAAGW